MLLILLQVRFILLLVKQQMADDLDFNQTLLAILYIVCNKNQNKLLCN